MARHSAMSPERERGVWRAGGAPPLRPNASLTLRVTASMSSRAMARGGHRIVDVAGNDERVTLPRTLRDVRGVDGDRVHAVFRGVERTAFDVVEVMGVT